MIKAVHDWYIPRKQQSFLCRLGRNFVVYLPMWPINYLWSRDWWEGASYVTLMSFAFALGQYGYFHFYGGTDEDYPFPPDRGVSLKS